MLCIFYSYSYKTKAATLQTFLKFSDLREGLRPPTFLIAPMPTTMNSYYILIYIAHRFCGFVEMY